VQLAKIQSDNIAKGRPMNPDNVEFEIDLAARKAQGHLLDALVHEQTIERTVEPPRGKSRSVRADGEARRAVEEERGAAEGREMVARNAQHELDRRRHRREQEEESLRQKQAEDARLETLIEAIAKKLTVNSEQNQSD
jgi:hypothetical protein